MPRLETPVRIFDPAAPFETHPVERCCVDTWHQTTLVTRKAQALVPDVTVLGEGEVPTSGGVSMNAPLVEIGLDIGSIRILRIEALLVDQGRYDLVLGLGILERALALGQGSAGVEVTSGPREDPRALSLELLPVGGILGVSQFTGLLEACRALYEIGVITRGLPTPPAPTALESGRELEALLRPASRLRVTWLQMEPTWVTLRSDRTEALRDLAGIFPTGATAALQFEAAAHERGEARTAFLSARRGGTLVMMAREEEMIRDGRETAFDQWCEELPEKLAYLEEGIEALGGRDATESLRERRDRAVQVIREARILPICRRVPH